MPSSSREVTSARHPANVESVKSADGREVPLALASGAKGDGPVLEGRGVPGAYELVPPDEWRAFGTTEAQDIRTDVPPVKIGIGRKHSIYVWPPQGRWCLDSR